MDFFIDTANIEEIREANELGIIDGVTTNPSLIAKEGRDIKDVICDICDIIDGPVSAEVISLKAKDMLKEARVLAELHSNIVVKVPMTIDGLKVTRQLATDGINTNVTLVFSPLQALMASKAGATYVSPFVGRLDDLSCKGVDLVNQINTIYNNYDKYDTKIIVASIRSSMHILDSAIIGADIVTVPFKILKEITKHPLTDKGLDSFLNDWKRARK